MSNFFDKLKKGMEIEELPKEEGIKPSLEENKNIKKQKIAKPISATPIALIENQNQEVSAEKATPPETIKKTKIKRVATRAKKNEAEFAQLNTIEPLIKFGPVEKQWSRLEGQPAVDIFQTDKEIIIQSALAGVKPENLEISINNDIISFSGTREAAAEFTSKDYFRQECYWGSFFREIIMPEETETKNTKVSFKEGILTLRIPKKLSH